MKHLLTLNRSPGGPFGPHSGLMAVYFRSPGSSTTPFKVVVRPPNVYEEVCFGRIAVYGSTELTLPDDSILIPLILYIPVSDDISLLNSIFFLSTVEENAN